VSSRYSTILGHNYATAKPRTVSAMDFDTLIPQGYRTVGKIPLGSLLLEPVAPKQETFNLVRHRHIGFEVVTINDKRQSSVTKNVKALLAVKRENCEGVKFAFGARSAAMTDRSQPLSRRHFTGSPLTLAVT